MKFLLQKEKEDITDIDVFNLKLILDRHPYQYEYSYAKLSDVLSLEKDFSGVVPVGTLEFVGEWLKRYHNIENLHPIEVPKVLKKEKYLKREYVIIEKDFLPESGRYFLKYLSRLKEFSFTGDIVDAENGYKDGFVLPDGLYQLSEAVDFISEYRIIVMEDEIKAIQHYDGDPTVFPDVNLIKEMVLQLMRDTNRPLAYTMDIGVIRGRGTAIIEMHPAVSFGTYGYSGSDLPYIYKVGLDYYINVNQPLAGE